ncbi:MAG: peptidoglycan-binding protein, partial [Rhodobacteraceae bacterium]|nr:peptidoglycan-binding protein [Paracoccaceae bacterium]
MAAKLKAPVGLAPRKSEGDPVRNNSEDVELVRKALVANGYKSLPVNGKVDGGLLKAIAAFQKKTGFKNPDQVVDPGSRTWKALAPALEKMLAEEAKAEKIPMRKIKWKGKEYLLTEKDYQAMRLDIFKRLDRYMKSLIASNKLNQKTFNEYIETAQIKRGLMDAVTNAIIMSWRDVKFPSGTLAGRSAAATKQLERAIASKDLKLLQTALPEAEKAINEFSTDVLRFLKDFTGSAQSVATVLNVTSAVAFGIVGVMAAPVLVTATGMTAASAAVVSGAGVAVVQSTSQELGKHAAGQKVTVFESVKAVALDGAVGVLTAGLGNKIPVKWADELGAALAPKVAAKVPWLTKETAETLLKGY